MRKKCLDENPFIISISEVDDWERDSNDNILIKINKKEFIY